MLQRRSWLPPLALFVVAVLLYGPTSSYDYAWDDKLVITANDYTKRGIRGLRDVFTKRVSIPYKSEYRPVPQALHAIEYDLFGGSPRAGHSFNVLWYGLACVMVYGFVRFTFVRAHEAFAFLVALLFAVHPLHVEVVANIKGRDEILSLLFGLSSVVLLVKAMERPRWLAWIGGVACFALACLSKSNAVTLLAVVPLVAWFRSNETRISRRILVSIAVIAACSVALVALIRHLQSTVSAETQLHLESTVLNNVFLWTSRPRTIVPTALVIVARYLRLFAIPHPLIHLYGYDQVPLSTWRDALTWLVVAGLLATAVAILRTWKGKAPPVFGVFFFAITYSPYSNLWFYAPDTMADRYMFVPSIGLAIVVVYGLWRLAGADLRQPSIGSARARACAAFFVVMLLGHGVRTLLGSRDWRNDATLIYNRIRYLENNAAAQAVYGHTLAQEAYRASDPETRRARKGEAMRAFMRAIEIYPDFQAAWIAAGRLFAEQGFDEKAELAFLKAQRLEPLSPEAYLCLGTLYLSRRDPDLAIPYLEKSVLLDPKGEEAYVMLGKAYLQAGHLDNLGAMTTTAVSWFPGNLDLRAQLATFHFRKGDYRRAVELAREVLAREPENILARAIVSSPLTQEFARWSGSGEGAEGGGVRDHKP